MVGVGCVNGIHLKYGWNELFDFVQESEQSEGRSVLLDHLATKVEGWMACRRSKADRQAANKAGRQTWLLL